MNNQTIRVKVNKDLTLDIGSYTEDDCRFVIIPPETPIIDQLINYLDRFNYHSNIRSNKFGVGLTALCVRWGSYLASLMDENAPLHPEIEHYTDKTQSNNFVFLTDSEMNKH